MEQAVVDVNDLSRSFGNKTALHGVSFRATAGQVHGLVGANGAGKTTLLKHLLGLLRATAGSVRVFGLDPVRDPVGVLSRVGYLSEERELPEWMRIDALLAEAHQLNFTADEILRMVRERKAAMDETTAESTKAEKRQQ